jgi:hypothetical protein
MIGRADIEGSKCSVAMNAWLPQASYPCGNFSDTYVPKLWAYKGSLGQDFTVSLRTEKLNQADIYPCDLREVSVHSESTLGHLRYRLVDVPPQPNSPSGCVSLEMAARTAGTDRKDVRHAVVPKVRSQRDKQRNVKGSGISSSACASHLCYTPRVSSQSQTRVKLNRVFFPRCIFQARSLGCGFARSSLGTVGISLIHSCASLIR